MGQEFSPFGIQHTVVIVVALILGAALTLWLGRARDDATRLARARTCGQIILACAILSSIRLCWPGNFDISVSLPLDLCDMAWFVAAWAMISRREWPRLAIYYWGIGLSTQAFFTPTLKHGPATIQFWDFWVSHWQIVAVAFIEIIVFKLRPTMRDYLRMAATGTLIFVTIALVNLPLGTNYFFAGSRKPTHPTLIDAFGEWPLRLLWMEIAVCLWWLLLTLPFVILRWNRRGRIDRLEAA